MKYDNFKEIIDLQCKFFQNSLKLNELGVDLVTFTETSEKAIELLWEEILTKEGDDWLLWFIWEKEYAFGELREDLKAYDENGDEIVKTLEELHQYLVDNKMFKK